MDSRIVCFGDSNTYGYDPRSCLGGRYPEAARWTALLETAGWEITNKGENGRCIPQRRQDVDILIQTIHHAKAEMVAVMLGSNDLLQRPAPSAETCGERMERFLTMLLEEVPASCKILLIAPPPMKLGAWVNDAETLEESHRLVGCYEVLAQRLGIPFADAGTWDVELTFDGVHFSEEGHRTFANRIQKILEQLISPETNECCQE